jgi:hypothetical protein
MRCDAVYQKTFLSLSGGDKESLEVLGKNVDPK